MTTKITIHKNLSQDVALRLLGADHELKDAISEYAQITFNDGKPSGAAGFAIQCAVQIAARTGKKVDEYSDGDGDLVAGIKQKCARYIRICNASPLNISKRKVKDNTYAMIKTLELFRDLDGEQL